MRRIDRNGADVGGDEQSRPAAGNAERGAGTTLAADVSAVLVLILLGAMLFSATAQASVSPEHQATLNQHGYSVESEDAALPVTTTQSDRCSQVKRRKLGTWIKNWNDNRMAGERVIVTACARGGEIKSVTRAYWCASPGHKWERVWGPYPQMFLNGVEARSEFKRLFWVDQYWRATVRLRARVKSGTEHVIRWMKTRRWS